MVLVKTKKTLLLVISLLIGFLSGCSEITPDFIKRPAEYEIYSILDRYYYKDLDFKLSDVTSTKDMIERLNDPYTYIYEANTRSIEFGEFYHGIGVTIIDTESGLLVTEINPLANLKTVYPFDIITKVNDQPLEGLSFNDKQNLLIGSLNDLFTLSILRGDQTIVTTVTIKEIPLNSVSYKNYDGIGLIDINRFSGNADDLFNTYLAALESEAIQGLIIDVRDNGGGYLDSVVSILNNFMIGEDAFLSMHRVYDDHYDRYFPIENAVPKTYPIVVLMNENSASASEVLAIAMKENGSYPLIGNKSFGKDVYQVSYSVEKSGENKLLNMTQGYWLSPKLNSVSGGILPDYEVAKHELFLFDYPMYVKPIELGMSLESEEALVSLINLLETSLPSFTLSTFDEAFEVKVRAYQEQNDLLVTGKLDYQTILNLIDQYQLLEQNELYDLQLQYALSYMVNYES